MKIKPHISRLLPSKQAFAILLAAAIFITSTFAGCTKKSDQKTQTNAKDTPSEIIELTPTETPKEKPKDTEEEDSDKVISPNTVYDSDEDSHSPSSSDSDSASNTKPDSDSSTDSNTASAPKPTPTPKPVVKPETEPELEPEQTELTAKMADDMIPLFDSMALAVSELGADNYDPVSTNYVWCCLYLAMVNYAEDGHNGISYSDDYLYKYAPTSVVLEYASSMFAGMTKLPAIPDSQSSHVVYLPDKDYYQFTSGDRGASFTVVTGITAEEGGTYLVDTSMRTHSDEGTYVVHADYTFRVKPNSSDNSNMSLNLPYVIAELVKSTAYEDKVITESFS